MKQDHRGCRRMMIETAIAAFVILLTLGAMIALGLRHHEASPFADPVAPPAAEAVDLPAGESGEVRDLLRQDAAR